MKDPSHPPEDGDIGMRTIRFSCPSCSRTIKAPGHTAGKKGTCPNCKNAISVPISDVAPPAAPPDKVDLADCCPSCNAQLVAKAVICVNCGLDLRTGQLIGGRARDSTAGGTPTRNLLHGASLAGRKWYEQKIFQAPARVLKCSHCGTEFWINNDSTIRNYRNVLPELLEMLEQGGATNINKPPAKLVIS